MNFNNLVNFTLEDQFSDTIIGTDFRKYAENNAFMPISEVSSSS